MREVKTEIKIVGSNDMEELIELLSIFEVVLEMEHVGKEKVISYKGVQIYQRESATLSIM